jgi:hypothetical protein
MTYQQIRYFTCSFSDSDKEPGDAVDGDVGEHGGGVPDGRQSGPFVRTMRLEKRLSILENFKENKNSMI